MIKGSGLLITEVDEEGNDLPFLTTEEILKQIMKFGFYVQYDVKKNLPTATLTYLAQVENLGYDKITRVAVESRDTTGQKVWKPTIIVMKSEFNDDLLTFDCKVTRNVFNAKLEANSLINVTHEPDTQWDWVSYIANIVDILNENVDSADGLVIIDESRSITDVPKDYTEYNESSLSIYTAHPGYTEYNEVAEDSDSFEGTVYTDPSEEETGLEG